MLEPKRNRFFKGNLSIQFVDWIFFSIHQQPPSSAEHNGSRLGIHFFNDSKALEIDAFFPQGITASLESFFNTDTNPFDSPASLVDKVHQSFNGTAIGKKIIDDKDMISAVEIFFGNKESTLPTAAT